MTIAKKSSTKKTVTKAPKGGTRGRKSTSRATGPTSDRKATLAKRTPLKTEEEAKARKLSLLDAAVEVMKQQDEPLGVKDIATKVISLGLWKTKGKTPEATLYSAIIREISGKGKGSRFRKVGRGRFELTETSADV